jgi:hypothetical protein
MLGLIIGIIVLVVIGIAVIGINVAMRRKGYSVPGKTAVRCSKGHLFRTTWIAGGSLKAVRLGPTTRFAHCPVGKHWAIIHPIKDADLSEEDRRVLAGSAG